MRSSPGLFLAFPSPRCLRQRVKRGWIPSGSESRVGRPEGRIWPPTFASSSSSSSPLGAGLAQQEHRNPGSGAPGKGQGEREKPSELRARSCFQANSLPANEQGGMRGRSQAGFFGNRAVKLNGRRGKNWCQSIGRLWEGEMLSQLSPQPHRGTARPSCTPIHRLPGWDLPGLLLTPIHGVTWNICQAGGAWL